MTGPGKVTPSRDGVARMTLRVEHRVGRDEFVGILCHRLRYEADTPIGWTSRRAVIEDVRTTLHLDGADGWWMWRDAFDFEPEAADALEEAVTAEVDRLFPEFTH